jgi:hypothetical protein
MVGPIMPYMMPANEWIQCRPAGPEAELGMCVCFSR